MVQTDHLMTFEKNGKMTLLLTFCILLSLFFSINLFFSKSGSPSSNRILGATLLLVSLILVDFSESLSASIYFSSTLFKLITQSAFFLIGPLFFLYAKSRYTKVKLKDHAFDFLFGFLILSTILMTKALYVVNAFWRDLIEYLFIGVLFIKMLHLLHYFKKYQQVSASKELKVITTSFIFLIIIFGCQLILVISGHYYSYNSEVKLMLALFTAIIILLITSQVLINGEKIVGISPILKRYASNKLLSDWQIDELEAKIQFTLKEEKVYLDSEYRLDHLADHLKTNRSYLSFVINNRFKTSFPSYLNKLRISRAIELMPMVKSKKLNLLELCFKVGFNSKSAFNHAFKKETGLTPSEYQKKTTNR